jgi:GDP-L-fucose synthase
VSGFWHDKKVIVPGGAGFLGSSVVDALVTTGARVTVIDDESHGDFTRLADHGDTIERIRADLTASIDLTGIFHGSHAVLDFAGVAPGLMEDESRHEILYQKNLRLAGAILQAALRAEVPHLLVVSSSCVYPDDAPVPTPEMLLMGNLPEHANRGYGRAKREIEARAVAAMGGPVRITLARPFNACGPRDIHGGPGSHVIPSLLTKILDPRVPEVVVWGSGSQTRAFIDARDLASAVLLLIEHHHGPQAVNIGTAEEITLAELASHLMRACGVDKPLVFDTSRPEGAAKKSCDASLLRDLTGFTPRFGLEASLRDIVQARLETGFRDDLASGGLFK